MRRCYLAYMLLLIGSLLLADSALAANYYVRPNGGAYGSEDGTDWTNAFDGWADISWGGIGGGDTIYASGGTYTQNLSPAAAGASSVSKITIKRATTADHGTETGWSAGFDSTLQMNGAMIRLSHDDDFITIDGATQYGWVMSIADGGTGVQILHASAAGDTYQFITIRNMEIVGPGYQINFISSTRGIDATPLYGDTLNDLLIEYVSIHEVESPIYLTNTRVATIRYSEFYDIDDTVSNPCCHENIIYISNANDVVYAHNKSWNSTAVTGSENIFFNGASDNWDIYGNIWWGTRRFIECDGVACTNISIYNNTVVDIDYRFIGWINSATGSPIVKGNIFFNADGTNPNMVYQGGSTRDYNWYSGSSSQGEANSIAAGAADPFTDASSDDYTIVATTGATYPKDKSVDLGSAYETDLLGNTRGDDGTWDIGAYEYTTAPATYHNVFKGGSFKGGSMK